MEPTHDDPPVRDDISAAQLIRRMGHDFNNLFSIILGGLSLLREEMPQSAWPAEASEVYDDVVSATREAADVIASLTAWAARQAIEPEDVELNALLAELQPLVRHALPDTIAIECTPATAPVPVWADRARLQDAVLELLGNARDAMPAGGRLQLAVEPHPRPTLLVSDSGEGMDTSTLVQCTTPYFSTRGGGTRRGLGLSVVDGFMRASNGALVLSSAPGQGTCARLEFTRADDGS